MPNYRVPAETVRLGRPLDLWVRKGNQVTHYNGPDFKGFQMLTTPEAEELAPGRARLFLLKPRTVKAGGRVHSAGARTYEMWHRKNPKGATELRGLPDDIATLLGRAEQLDYRSSKWQSRGAPRAYTHTFLEGLPPLVYADRLKNPRAFVLVGGDMTITRHGIA